MSCSASRVKLWGGGRHWRLKIEDGMEGVGAGTDSRNMWASKQMLSNKHLRSSTDSRGIKGFFLLESPSSLQRAHSITKSLRLGYGYNRCMLYSWIITCNLTLWPHTQKVGLLFWQSSQNAASRLDSEMAMGLTTRHKSKPKTSPQDVRDVVKPGS